jgi:glycine betaine catabolism A
MEPMRHPLSPRLDHCPEGLPRAAYLDEAWYQREMAGIFAREWICAGRLDDLTPGRMRKVQLGAAPVILCCDAEGGLSAFHNSCRHRGAELCREDEEPLGKLIRCPYHAFAYAATDGRLVATGPAHPTADFDRAAHGLRPVQVQVWNGFVFLNAGDGAQPIQSDVGLGTLDNWPMDGLVTGHRWQVEIACNWKGFWENYSECLHCPGVHPELCDMVPIYKTGVMGASEALGWTPEAAAPGNLKPGAQTWTLTGEPCGPVFAGLTAAERAAGYTFVTMWPSVYVVAHVDYVRSVRIEPLGPEKTRLVAEWHFAPETLARPGFDAGEVAAFAKIVMEQDGRASEMNQRGIRSPSFTAARLMPEEYEIHRFHGWIAKRLEAAP